MVTEIELFEFPDVTPLDFCLCAWMKCEFYKMKVDTRDELPGDTLNAAAQKKTLSTQTTRDLCNKLQSALMLTEGFSDICCEP